MYPDLFSFPVPSFLRSFLPDHLTIHTYGFFIAVGILASYLFILRQGKRQFNANADDVTTYVILLVLAGIIGGKVFFYLEDPSFYFRYPERLVSNFGSGFVFYGSFIFAVPLMLYIYRRFHWPTLKMLDIMAFVACIVHAFGRMGCFFAGCCHGKPTDSIFGVTFTNPSCSANPLGIPLHPTQLYEVFMLLLILIALHFAKYKIRYHGQLFLLYVFLYAIGRFVLEFFRGDNDRGFLFGGAISHSQFIALLMAASVLVGNRLLVLRQRKRDESSRVQPGKH
jgi:phosphatidylglycerol:prolipoprotein diacylglycerol transferase